MTTLLPVPITGRTAMLLETAEGCVARSEIRSRAIGFLADRMNATARQMVAQGFDKETVAAEMVAFFKAVKARVNAMGCTTTAQMEIDIDCINMTIKHGSGQAMAG